MYHPASFIGVWLAVVFVVLILPAWLFCLFLRKVKKSIADDKEKVDLKRQKETELLQAQIDYYNAQKQALEKKEQEASE